MNSHKKIESGRARGVINKSLPNEPLISVITVVLNGAAYLEQTIRSVLDQDYPNLEYLVIDGGSTDGTLDIIRKYAESGDVHKYVSEPDEGIADAFNKGIALSSGELIGLINADDYCLPGALKKVASAYRAAGSEVIIHGNMIVEKDGRKVRIRPRPFPRLWKYVDFPFNHPAMFVPKKIYDKLGGYDKRCRYAMDYDFSLRAMQSGVTFKFLDEDLACFSIEGVSSQAPINCHKEVLRSQRENGLFVPACYLTYFMKVAVNYLKRLF